MALGHPSVKACQRAISSSEFAGWKAYYQRNPFGPLRDDQRFGTVAAVIANVHRDPKKRRKPHSWQDFFRPEPEKPQTWEDMLAVMTMWVETTSGDDKQQSTA